VDVVEHKNSKERSLNMSSIVVEMFTDVSVSVLRVREGKVIYREDVNDHGGLCRAVIERAADIASMPSLPRLILVEAEVSTDLVAIVRYFGCSALVAICPWEHRQQARFRLEQFNQRDLHLFGGGLSNTALDPSVIFGSTDAGHGSEAPCTAAAVAAFLNEAFEFVFSLTSQSLRVAYARSYANRYAFLNAQGGSLVATDELHLLDAREQADLGTKFERMLDAVDMQKLRDLQSSPLSSPPWTTATHADASATNPPTPQKASQQASGKQDAS
jgi:hypothetical protein